MALLICYCFVKPAQTAYCLLQVTLSTKYAQLRQFRKPTAPLTLLETKSMLKPAIMHIKTENVAKCSCACTKCTNSNFHRRNEKHCSNRLQLVWIKTFQLRLWIWAICWADKENTKDSWLLEWLGTSYHVICVRSDYIKNSTIVAPKESTKEKLNSENGKTLPRWRMPEKLTVIELRMLTSPPERGNQHHDETGTQKMRLKEWPPFMHTVHATFPAIRFFLLHYLLHTCLVSCYALLVFGTPVTLKIRGKLNATNTVCQTMNEAVVFQSCSPSTAGDGWPITEAEGKYRTNGIGRQLLQLPTSIEPLNVLTPSTNSADDPNVVKGNESELKVPCKRSAAIGVAGLLNNGVNQYSKHCSSTQHTETYTVNHVRCQQCSST